MPESRRFGLTPVTEAHTKLLDMGLSSGVLIGAVAAYFFSPVQKFADWSMLYMIGSLLCVSLLIATLARVRTGPVIQYVWVGVSFAISAVLFYFVGSQALSRSNWNDRRCLVLQDAMLRPGPNTRSDIADVFTAMQCRPQGQGPKTDYSYTRGERPDMARLQAEQARQDKALVDEVQVDKVEALQPRPGPPGSPSRATKALAAPKPAPTLSGSPRPALTPARPGER